MSEWWSYRPSSFLLFSERTYRRLFELYNADVWPAHPLALVLGVVLLALLLGGRPNAARPALALLGVCWLWVACAFLWQRYATINWAAVPFVVAFVVEAAGLLVAAAAGVRLRGRDVPGADGAGRVGVAVGAGLVVVALVMPAVLAMLAQRRWQAAEVFGLAPDPTVIATLGVLALLRAHGAPVWRRARRTLVALLWAAPLAWCVFSALLLWAMRAPEAGLLPLAALLALIAARTG
jgi:hypothetical protein